MWTMIKTALLGALIVVVTASTDDQTFSVLNLHSVGYTLRPADTFCEKASLVAVVHSAVANADLRNTIRGTWASVDGLRTVFVLGATGGDEAASAQEAVLVEHRLHGDIVQGSFVDAYRNMTYKHLLAYRWVRDHCPSASYVLKSDDDQAIDTFHLPKFLRHFFPLGRDEPAFLLCQFVVEQKVLRDVSSKWFVTTDEFADSEYPGYCAGWAYVTNVAAIDLTLGAASARDDYFWIDDVFVTGVLRSADIRVFDWKNAFLNYHAHLTEEVLRGPEFSPELLVCSDLNPQEMSTMFVKYRECHSKRWVEDHVYSSPRAVDVLRPQVIDLTVKTEL